MANVTIRDLRNHGGDVIARAQAGERLTITRAGKPVAELTAIPRSPLSARELRARRAHLPHVNPDAMREEIDAVIDPTL